VGVILYPNRWLSQRFYRLRSSHASDVCGHGPLAAVGSSGATPVYSGRPPARAQSAASGRYHTVGRVQLEAQLGAAHERR
jgi:hypothetical protein